MPMNDISNRIRDGLKRRARMVEASARSVWLHRAAKSDQFRITHPDGPVVSLTTYGNRINYVHIAIESIARGELKPSRLILWLDQKSAKGVLPGALRKQAQRGLEIKTCEDLGPHKKYYPYLESCGAIETPLVTADDDLLYPKSWLKKLVHEHRRHPDVVNCYRARRIRFDGQELARYENWELTKSTDPSFCHFAGSGAGAILPVPLQVFIKRAGTAFLSCCQNADDIWLHVQSLRAGYRVRQIQKREFRLIEIPGSQMQALHHNNLAGGGNDRQIVATYSRSDLEMLRTCSN